MRGVHVKDGNIISLEGDGEDYLRNAHAALVRVGSEASAHSLSSMLGAEAAQERLRLMRDAEEDYMEEEYAKVAHLANQAIISTDALTRIAQQAFSAAKSALELAGYESAVKVDEVAERHEGTVN